MLHNSISVDMQVYALQLKEKSTADVSNRILQNFRTAAFENNLRGLRRGVEERALTLVISGFHFFQDCYLLSHETMFFLHKFSIWIMLSIFIYLRKGLVVQFFIKLNYLPNSNQIFLPLKP